MPKDRTIAPFSLPATPLQMVSGYAVFANGGYRVDSYFVERIENAAAHMVFQATPNAVCERSNGGEARNDAAPANATGGTLVATLTSTTGTPGTPGTPGDPDRKPANALPPLVNPA